MSQIPQPLSLSGLVTGLWSERQQGLPQCPAWAGQRAQLCQLLALSWFLAALRSRGPSSIYSYSYLKGEFFSWEKCQNPLVSQKERIAEESAPEGKKTLLAGRREGGEMEEPWEVGREVEDC